MGLTRLPLFRMLTVFLLAALALSLSLSQATSRYMIKPALQGEEVLHTTSDLIEVEGEDLLPEPGEISDDAVLREFFEGSIRSRPSFRIRRHNALTRRERPY